MIYESEGTWFEYNALPTKLTPSRLEEWQAEVEAESRITVRELCDKILASNQPNYIVRSAVQREMLRRGYNLGPADEPMKIKHGPQCGCSAYICAACLGLEPYER